MRRGFQAEERVKVNKANIKQQIADQKRVIYILIFRKSKKIEDNFNNYWSGIVIPVPH